MYGNKVPALTLLFWLIKLLATTAGEALADTLTSVLPASASLRGALVAALLAGALCLQVRARNCQPWRYWLTVVLASVVGTQIVDTCTDRLQVSLLFCTIQFSATLLGLFGIWFVTEYTLSIRTIHTPRRELFYWATVLCSFALGTALSELATESAGLGYHFGALTFSLMIGLTVAAWRLGENSVTTFWIAFVLTRPLGVALADLLSQPRHHDGLGLGAPHTSLMFLTGIIVLVAYTEWRQLNPR